MITVSFAPVTDVNVIRTFSPQKGFSTHEQLFGAKVDANNEAELDGLIKKVYLKSKVYGPVDLPTPEAGKIIKRTDASGNASGYFMLESDLKNWAAKWIAML